MKCQINLDIYNPEAPAFWPAAPLRRTSVFAASENLGAGRIHSARAGSKGVPGHAGVSGAELHPRTVGNADF